MADFWKHWSGIGLVQVFDLVVIAVLIYLAMVWLKHRASRALAGVLLLVVMMYSTARFLDMPFTLAVFREGFTVIAVALLLIFQKDLRWAFERLFSTTAWGSQDTESPAGVIETVAESADALAKSKTGALIVFEGSEPLDQHVRGGIELDSTVSLPLLMSIFDDSSAGHDGALVIKNGRATIFGAHLPLATEELPEQFGTRHSAGMGLSEVSDALVIIVSEERGKISVCRNGKLEVMESVASLKQRLEDFHSSQAGETGNPVLRRLVLKNWTLKLAAILLAGLVSVVFADRARTVERSYEVPVEFANRPANWVGEAPDPPRVRVTISGSETAFDLFDESKLKISLDANQLEEGAQSVRIRLRNINVKAPLKLERIHPQQIRVTSYRLKPITLNVTLWRVGLPPEGVTVERVELESKQARLLWPMAMKKPPSQLLTEPVDLSRVTKSQTIRVALQIPANAKPDAGQATTVPVKVVVKKTPAKEPN